MRLLTLAVLALAAPEPLRPAEFPESFQLTAMMRMPYSNMDMPVSVVSTPQWQKISYYRDLQVEIYDREKGNFKAVFNVTNRMCMQTSEGVGPTSLLSSANSAQVGITFFPDLSTYTYVGQQLRGGIMCDKYIASEEHGTSHTMDDHIEYFHDPILNKPVQWHMHSRNKVFSSHTDEWILDYISLEEGSAAHRVPKECDTPVVRDFTMQSRGMFPTHNQFTVFNQFLATNQKQYRGAELVARRATFERNLAMIMDLNAKPDATASFAANSYLDMDLTEFLKYRGGKKRRGALMSSRERNYYQPTGMKLPENFDWRKEDPKIVGPVKDQGMCGSCWAFSFIASVEAITAKKRQTSVELLPEQMIVDCTWSSGSSACDGGNSDDAAFQIMERYGSEIPIARDYGSYLSVDGYCKPTKNMQKGAQVSGWTYIKNRDAAGLKEALVTEGPLSIGINVVPEMVFYDRGVLDVESCENHEDIDHAVTMVGYGKDTESGLDYYTIRNSWSSYWGHEGHVHVRAGKRDCAVSSEAGFPLVVV